MVAPWIQLYNSEYFDFDKPSYSQISIETIAHSLSMQCRYNGHSTDFYSVSEHSVLVAKRVYELTGNPMYCLHGLLHDASEAIICDVPRPLKYIYDMEWYRSVEKEIQRNLYIRFIGEYDFSLAAEYTDKADFELLSTEKEQIMPEPPFAWGYLPPSLNYKIECLVPLEAKERFLSTYNRYKSDLEKFKYSRKIF